MNHGWLSRHSGWCLLGVGLFLWCFQATHDLPSGYGIEDFLAFTDEGAIEKARELWQPVQWYGIAYMAFDLIAFIPLYALVTLQIVGWLGNNTAAGSDEHGVLRFASSTIIASLFALIGIDLTETAPGLMRLELGTIAILCTLLCSTGLWLIAYNSLGGHGNQTNMKAAAVGMAVAVAWILSFTLAAQMSDDGICLADRPSKATGILLSASCVAHRSKNLFMAILGAAIATSIFIWFSGAWAEDEERIGRSKLRAVMFEILARSRYILFGLMLLALLLLGLDQCRDVLIGTVSAAISNVDKGLQAKQGVVWVITVGAISLISLWMLSHTCWLWSRVQSRIPDNSSNDEELEQDIKNRAESIAKTFARILGAAPLVIFVLLTSQAISALAAVILVNSSGDAMLPFAAFEMHFLLIVALVAFAVGILFQVTREAVARKSRIERYYNDNSLNHDNDGKVRFSRWTGPRWKFLKVFPCAPIYLPIASLIALVLVRIPAGFPSDGMPPLALPIMFLSFSAWLGVFGWIAVLERRYAMPWGLIPVVLAGVLSTYGLTDNHIVEPLAVNASEIPGTGGLWIASSALALILGAAAWWFVARAPDARTCQKLLVMILVIGALGILVSMADSSFHRKIEVASAVSGSSSDRDPFALRKCNPDEKETCLEKALDNWLKALLELHKKEKDEDQQIEVYFVATEGGGSRAAYWTAHVLAWLSPEKDAPAQKSEKDIPIRSMRRETFLDHTFAISAVSGGSVGAAAFISCERSMDRKKCLENFDNTDLISPLIGAWLFDDVIAQIIPTSLCKTPGCGFLSRGIWFETTLARRVSPMADGVLKNRNSGKVGERHQPYLFMNSTRVETGERVIASEMRIDPYSFPNAIGEYELMGRDQSLATAAHNSARFPFTNPIGLVMSNDCLNKGGEMEGDATSKKRNERRCLHLADGGYYDNGGGQTILDVLRGLQKLLDTGKSEHIKWAKEHLDPRLILIHNGIEGEPCLADDDVRASKKSVECTEKLKDGWAPEKQTRAAPLAFSANTLGPPMAAIMTSIGQRNRADSLACGELVDLRKQLTKLKQDSRGEVVRLSQQSDGRTYPLGWYLSADARDAMSQQVEALKVDFVPCGNSPSIQQEASLPARLATSLMY